MLNLTRKAGHSVGYLRPWREVHAERYAGGEVGGAGSMQRN